MANKMIKTESIAAPVSGNEVTQSQQVEEARRKVTEAIATIRENLPFLVDLTAEERRTMPKLGDGSWSFVKKALELALHNQDFLPRTFDVEAMRQKAERWEQLSMHLLEVNELQELMDDTYVALGSELFSEALKIYRFAKAADHTGTLEQAVVELGKRFARKTNKKPSHEAIESTPQQSED